MSSSVKYFLQPGYLYLSQGSCLISTVLGSCVSVCLWDKVNTFGGMNHFIYPRVGEDNRGTRYGDVSVNHLIKMMIDAGSKKNDLIVHILGGAASSHFNSNLGYENTIVAEEIILKHGFNVVTRDVGGNVGRKIVFDTFTGEVMVYKCMKLRESDWY